MLFQEHRPYVQLSAFDCSGLSSGPVLIIDKKTFYIPHLHYPNDELFSFGVENDDNLTLHSMEYNISSNRAENIYIRLPNIETISNYNYLSVAINDNKLCSVNIIKDNIPEEVSEDALFTVILHLSTILLNVKNIFDSRMITKEELQLGSVANIYLLELTVRKAKAILI